MKYFLGFLATVVLVVVVFILVIRGFTSDEKPKDQLILGDHANSSMSVQLTVDGRITAEQTHTGFRITVDRNQAKIETYKGYQNQVTNMKTYANNTEAYANFLRALDLAGFARGDDDSARNDERGVCATGSRFIYQVFNSTMGDKRYWTSSCGGGTFTGDEAKVRVLFQQQIPEFSKATAGLGL